MTAEFDTTRSSSSRPSTWTRWLVVAAVAGLILVGSVDRPPGCGLSQLGPLGVVGADKWVHALAYAGHAGALLYALATSDRSTQSVFALALGLAVAFGLAVELVQAPLPTRRFELLDLVANGVGATVLVVAWRAARGIRRPT